MAQQRDLKKERFWRRMIERQKCGRETVRAFCDRHGLAQTAFYFWRRELQRRCAAVSTSRLAAKSKPKPSGPSVSRQPRKVTCIAEKRESAPQWVPLSIIPGSAASAAPLEFVFPSGVTPRIGSDAPWELVVRVLGTCGIEAKEEARSC